MTFAEKIRAELPYLRRYARALTGNQRVGDNYVKATLQAIIAVPDEIFPGQSPRTGLYTVFHKIWNSSQADGAEQDFAEHRDTTGFGKPRFIAAPLSRQALLLSALEGFDAADVAQIIGCPEADVDGLLQDALQVLENEIPTSVLIIEDEPLISMELEQIVVSSGHEIAGTAATHRDAVASVQQNKPGLVLADIQLADGSSGIAAVAEILQSVNVPVIFITAYPERLLTGEHIEPTFLITKPFHPGAVRAAISQALYFETDEVTA
jgi:CheY-like chemotaxis protein